MEVYVCGGRIVSFFFFWGGGGGRGACWISINKKGARANRIIGR